MYSIHERDNMFTHEEIYLDYEVYVDPNPDPYAPGFVWAVCQNGDELDAGLEFDFDITLEAARSAVRDLVKKTQDLPKM